MTRKVLKSRGSRPLAVKRKRKRKPALVSPGAAGRFKARARTKTAVRSTAERAATLRAAVKRAEAAKSVASSLAKTLAAAVQIWTVAVHFPGTYGKTYHYLFDREPERPFAVVNVGNDGYKVVTIVGKTLGASPLATKWLVCEIDDRAYQARKNALTEVDALKAAVRGRLAEVAASPAGRTALITCDEKLRELTRDLQVAESLAGAHGL